MSLSLKYLVPVVIVLLFSWQIYRRVRKHIGRQRLQPKRMVARAVLFGVIAIVMGASKMSHADLALGLGAGLLGGIGLGWVGLRLTRFEQTEEGHFYTPNTYIGIGVIILFVARMAYRFFQISEMHPTAGQGTPIPVPQSSALTLFTFGMMAGYYIAYYAGVCLRCRAIEKAM